MVEERTGVSPAVWDMRFLKPLDMDILREAASFKAVVTVEDGTLKGGLFGAVSEALAPLAGSPVIKGLGIPDRFITHAAQNAQRTLCGLTPEGIASAVIEAIS